MNENKTGAVPVQTFADFQQHFRKTEEPAGLQDFLAANPYATNRQVLPFFDSKWQDQYDGARDRYLTESQKVHPSELFAPPKDTVFGVGAELQRAPAGKFRVLGWTSLCQVKTDQSKINPVWVDKDSFQEALSYLKTAPIDNHQIYVIYDDQGVYRANRSWASPEVYILSVKDNTQVDQNTAEAVATVST